MSFIFRPLLLLILITLISPASAFSANSKSITILSSKHKFPHSVKSSSKQINSGSKLVYLTQGEKPIKSRPADYGKLRLVSSKKIRQKISAKSAVVIDAVTGNSLYAHSPDLPWQPASTIKVLTGLIAIDSLPDNELVPVSRRASGMPRSKVYLKSGNKYPANDLINAVLLASANDASVALAEKIAGSEKVFSKLMTAKARSFGASNTICKTASGLTAKGQKSTARDLAKIFRTAMNNEHFAEKMAITKVKTRDGKVLRSHNKALWQVEGAEGGKTGYTNLARQTYVGKFKRGNDELIVAIMGSESMWDDIKRLVEYGFDRKEYLNSRVAASAQVPNMSHSPIQIVQLERDTQPTNPSIFLYDLAKQPAY